MAQLANLTKDIETAVNGLGSKKTIPSPEEEQQLLIAARKLVDRLEGPELGVWRVLNGPQGNAALKAAFGMRIFEAFDDDHGQETAQKLSEKTGAEKLLIVRIMRALCVLDIFQEVGEELYAHNSRSKKFTEPMFRTLISGMDLFGPYMGKMEDYLASISFRNPDNRSPSLFQYSMKTNMGFFEWLHTQPDKLEKFSATMTVITMLDLDTVVKSLATLLGERMEHDQASDDALIVDVGGGRGKILHNLRKMSPDLKGRMVVQDLAGEIAGLEAYDGIETMVHNFLTPQPVKDAHVYFFRHIFHDWPDNACREILKQTVPAMKRGHSRIVIMDTVLPNVGASLFQSFLDMSMMTISGMERTERHWRELLEGEGLQVVGIRSVGRSDSIIEAVLAE